MRGITKHTTTYQCIESDCDFCISADTHKGILFDQAIEKHEFDHSIAASDGITARIDSLIRYGPHVTQKLEVHGHSDGKNYKTGIDVRLLRLIIDGDDKGLIDFINNTYTRKYAPTLLERLHLS
ncbi:hypothetical protein PBI_KAMPE_67 [Gordonia phage Kampe]|uniref:Uncharacterized protein n=3 Tax=Gordonia phage Orchid TaxID=1838075 RepID=A0A160DHG2_9CAUD|nr:hypothetical protein BH761_gp066 [Gordonia phage Orchid]ANA87301.1 hypothetical protein PBI_PATRICKSTAR_67 [Gordonia phage PatrickStar]ANA87413.1 hypothetical protein PBI_ORCHID_66 [Gordonia phage Orchid]ANA87528.1 hypothetical protein PBI_KAMPE_67 [Gordonia phage Kampe]